MFDRLTQLIEVHEGGCWIWKGPVKGGNKRRGYYGGFEIEGHSYYAHRLVYQLTVGVIPKGLEIDHLCRNRQCVNPSHLEIVTHQENIRRHHVLTTLCPKGHAYTDENTYLDSDGARRCRQCHREEANAYYHSLSPEQREQRNERAKEATRRYRERRRAHVG